MSGKYSISTSLANARTAGEEAASHPLPQTSSDILLRHCDTFSFLQAGLTGGGGTHVSTPCPEMLPDRTHVPAANVQPFTASADTTQDDTTDPFSFNSLEEQSSVSSSAPTVMSLALAPGLRSTVVCSPGPGLSDVRQEFPHLQEKRELCFIKKKIRNFF